MKKWLLFILIVSLFNHSEIFCQLLPSIEWGMNRQEVKLIDTTAETQEALDKDKLYGWGRSFGAPARFEYTFIGEQLSEVSIFLFLDEMSGEESIALYNNQFKNLQQLYGESDAFNVKGENDEMEIDTDNWGMYLEQGKLKFITLWETKEHLISLILGNYSNNLKMLLHYKDINLR